MNTHEIEQKIRELLVRYSKEDYSLPKELSCEVDAIPDNTAKSRASVATKLLAGIEDRCTKREKEILALCKGHPGFFPKSALREVRKFAANMQAKLDQILLRWDMVSAFKGAGQDPLERDKLYKQVQEQEADIEALRRSRIEWIEREPIGDMTKYVFYSWQSELPNPTNRSLIQTAIERACKTLQRDDVELEIALDRDTCGTPGSPNIFETILNKIDRSAVFVADTSILPNGTPNPNVLIELGYALKIHGWSKIILVMNKAFGTPEKLPFDLRSQQVLVYDVREGEAPANGRKLLEKSVENKLRLMLSDSASTEGSVR